MRRRGTTWTNKCWKFSTDFGWCPRHIMEECRSSRKSSPKKKTLLFFVYRTSETIPANYFSIKNRQKLLFGTLAYFVFHTILVMALRSKTFEAATIAERRDQGSRRKEEIYIQSNSKICITFHASSCFCSIVDVSKQRRVKGWDETGGMNEVMVSVMVSDNMKTPHKPRNRLQKRQRQPSLAWLWPKEVTIHATNRIHSHLSLNDCEAAIAIRPFDFGPWAAPRVDERHPPASRPRTKRVCASKRWKRNDESVVWLWRRWASLWLSDIYIHNHEFPISHKWSYCFLLAQTTTRSWGQGQFRSWQSRRYWFNWYDSQMATRTRTQSQALPQQFQQSAPGTLYLRAKATW